MSAPEQTFISHLLELRDRLLRMVLAVVVALLVLFPFANQIYTFTAGPLMAVLPADSSMIATQVASPFLTPFKLSLIAAIFIAMPYLLYQFWAFLAPGLYQNEKRLALPILVSSILLFYLGAAFAYFVVFPLIFGFLTSVAPDGVEVMTDITHYLDFVLTLFFAFGLSFEVPIATVLLVLTGITTPDQLAKKRPYVIVGAFVIGMVLTPPDIISQTLLAVPVWLLFEVGILAARLLTRKKALDETTSEPIDEPTADTEQTHKNQYDTQESDSMTDAEMEAELDRLDAEEEANQEKHNTVTSEPATKSPEPFIPDAVDAKLERVMTLRDQEEYSRARILLYEVLAEGNAEQIKVARNILAQMDG